MVLRQLTLGEWFLRYQLLKQRDHHFYLPIELDVDVTKLFDIYKERAQKFPTTAVMIKAAALLFESCRFSHRVVFSTLFGPRMMEFNEPIVNLPLILRVGELDVLTATTLRQAHRKTLDEISSEVKTALQRKLSDYPIAHFVTRGKNNAFNRLCLRLLCYLAYHLPFLYAKKGGGGVSVSSLYNHAADGFQCRPYSYGPTALTFCFSSLEVRENRRILKIGVGYDHTAMTGNEMMLALKEFSKIVATMEE